MPRPLHGRLHQFDEPVWDPLIAAVGERLVRWFMWMHELVLTDGRHVHAYKHVTTRRYLHLATDGCAFAYTRRDTYAPLALPAAIEAVFFEWEELHLKPDADEPAELARVLAEASARGLAGTASSSPNGRGDGDHDRAQAE